jgi:hypothetical protein
MVAFGAVDILLILALLQPPRVRCIYPLMRQAETLNVFQARLALLLSSKLSLRCGGAVVPAMILQTTQMRVLAVGVAWHRLFTSRVSMSESLTKSDFWDMVLRWP